MSEEQEFTAFKKSDGDVEFSRPYWAGIDLPDGWSAKIVGGNADVQGGKAFSGDRFSEKYTDSTPLVKRATVNNNRKPEQYLKGDFDDKYKVSEGDILVSMDGHFRVIFWEYEDSALNQRVCKVTPEGVFNSRYLSYALVDPMRQTEAATGATTVKSLSINDFEYIELPTPPVAEQERVASVLYSVDEKIRVLRDRRDSLTDLKHGLMQDLLTGETRVTSEIPARKDEIDNRELSEIDETEDWETYKIRDLIESRVGGAWGEEPEEGDYIGKVLRAGNYGDVNMDLSDMAERKIPDTKRDRKLSPDNIVLERSGGSKNQPVGRVMFFDIETDEDYYPTNFLEKIEVKDQFCKRYIYYLMDFKHASKDTVRYQTNTTNIRNLQMDAYFASDVDVPPLWEQERIASVLYAVDEMIQTTSELIDKYEELKRGLMQDLLSGEVRTPEDLEVLEEVTT